MYLMTRRGPDSGGYWKDGERCSLGVRRLSIIDLSSNADQPMATVDRHYVIVYNGEIYNFQELRRELELKGIKFYSSGDTQVVLYALAEWGPEALKRFNGMFALGLYDTKEKSILLARDYAGIKPLYYMLTKEGLVFASQYDQILAHPWSKNLSVSNDALGLYLRLGYIPAPYAILQNTHMLEPGCWLKVFWNGRVEKHRFFEFPAYVEPTLSGNAAEQALDGALTNAVKRHLISDVPVGTFFSGGIDSPLITAKVNQISNGKIKAFTIGTNGDRYDESNDASIYAKQIGIEHKIEHIKMADLPGLLDDVVSSCGEPFADYSIFPTLVISKIARQKVKVMLSGDGGDELFWGYYGRFASVLEMARYFKEPYLLRRGRWALKRLSNAGDVNRNVCWPTIGDWYKAKHSRIPQGWLNKIFPDLPSYPKDFNLFDYYGWQLDKTAQWMRWSEFIGHLTMVLLKVDRASMYHSLEVRVPYLDKEVIDTAIKIDWKSCLDLNNRVGKIPLRKLLSKYTQYQTQSKRGFTVPIDEWLRGPLKQIFKDNIFSRGELLGLKINKKMIASFFDQHFDRKADYGWGLWVLLSLALWQNKYYK